MRASRIAHLTGSRVVQQNLTRPSLELLRVWHSYQKFVRTIYMNKTIDELGADILKLNNALLRVKKSSYSDYQKLVSKISSNLNFADEPSDRFKPIYGKPQMTFNPYYKLVIPSLTKLKTIRAKHSNATIKEIIEAHYIFYNLHCYLNCAGSDIYLEKEEVDLRNGGLVELFDSF
jgi:hypothetical protein